MIRMEIKMNMIVDVDVDFYVGAYLVNDVDEDVDVEV